MLDIIFNRSELKLMSYLYGLDVKEAFTSQIAENTGLSRSNVNNILKKLKEKGIVIGFNKKYIGEKNQPVKSYYLTELGEAFGWAYNDYEEFVRTYGVILELKESIKKKRPSSGV